MRYNKPQVTNTLNAVSTIQQISWTDNPHDGVSKTPLSSFDSQPRPAPCSASAYEADE
jgi:hypothetical protein